MNWRTYRSRLTSALNWYRAIPPNLVGASRIGLIQPRTLFVYGGRDRYFSSKAAQLTAKWVAGPYEYKVLPAQSHWIPEEAPELLARLIQEFIRRPS